MNPDATTLLIRVFIRLRRAGFGLGISELLDSAAAIQRGSEVLDEEHLKRKVRLLWCNSVHEMAEFDEAWASASLPHAGDIGEADKGQGPTPERETLQTNKEQLPPRQRPEKLPGFRTESLRPLPLQATFGPLASQSIAAPDSYWPVSRTFLAYMWRYLRRPLNDGPADVLNVEATVEDSARQGFYLAPVYKRRTRNYAHLILLVDRGGSMVPFHRFAANMVETAQHESDLGRVEVFYFHDVVGKYLYADPFLTEPVSLEQALENCVNDTSLLIVSDAGAARGLRKTTRIRTTSEFLFELRTHTQLLAWVNPVPEERWPGSSAQIIGHLVPMFQMDDDGLSNAIDVVRGQPGYRRINT